MYIFISYSRKDYEYANKLANSLLINGFDVWIDQRKIEVGDIFVKKIFEAIKSKNCGAFIIIMTDDSYKSDFVMQEISAAMKFNKKIFPLLLANECFPMFLGQQYKDVRSKELPPQDFYDTLQNFIHPKQERGTQVAPQANPTNRNQPLLFLATVFIGIFITLFICMLNYTIREDGDPSTTIASPVQDLTRVLLWDYDRDYATSVNLQKPLAEWNEGHLLYVKQADILRMAVDSPDGIGAETQYLKQGQEVVIKKNDAEGRIGFVGRDDWWWHVRPSQETTGGGWLPQSVLTDIPHNKWKKDQVLLTHNPGNFVGLYFDIDNSEYNEVLRHETSITIINENPAWRDEGWWWQVKTNGWDGWVKEEFLKADS